MRVEHEWQPPPDAAVEYLSSYGAGEAMVPVRGMRVGCFAVRRRLVSDTGIDCGRPVRQWLVEHVNTGIACMSDDDFDRAVKFADDISRFSAEDADGQTKEQVIRQLGLSVYEWMLGRLREEHALDFRTWQRERAECTQERA